MLSSINTAESVTILKGAAAIAEFLFGSKRRRREIYYLVEKESLPHFKLGAMICARPATLEAWIAAQEQTDRGAARQ